MRAIRRPGCAWDAVHGMELAPGGKVIFGVTVAGSGPDILDHVVAVGHSSSHAGAARRAGGMMVAGGRQWASGDGREMWVWEVGGQQVVGGTGSCGRRVARGWASSAERGWSCGPLHQSGVIRCSRFLVERQILTKF